MKPTALSYDMLKTEEGQLNAVYACFGSAAQHAQHFEAALGEFLLVFNKLANQQLTLESFEALDKKIRKQTMGALLHEFRKHVKINDPKVDRCLKLSLEKRNFLMHHYFREREGKLGIKKERMAILTELVQIGNLLEQAAGLVGGMRVAFSKAMSKKPESVDAEAVLFTIDVDLPDE